MAKSMEPQEKQQVREALLAWARRQLGTTEDRADQEQDASEIPQDEGHDLDEVWQSEQAADMNTLLEEHAEDREDALAWIEDLDFSAADTVRPGAIGRPATTSASVTRNRPSPWWPSHVGPAIAWRRGDQRSASAFSWARPWSRLFANPSGSSAI